MTERVEVKLEGLDALLGKLRQLPKATSKGVLRRVGLKVLRPIADKARELAPRKSGRLKRSIKVGTRLSRRQYLLAQGTQGYVDVYAGAGPLPQAIMQEFGTSDQTAQPFMRPAWDQGKDKLLTDVKNELWAEIQKAVNGL